MRKSLLLSLAGMMIVVCGCSTPTAPSKDVIIGYRYTASENPVANREGIINLKSFPVVTEPMTETVSRVCKEDSCKSGMFVIALKYQYSPHKISGTFEKTVTDRFVTSNYKIVITPSKDGPDLFTQAPIVQPFTLNLVQGEKTTLNLSDGSVVELEALTTD